MCTPVLSFGDYIVTFEAQEEEISARRHFVKECGWSESDFAKIENFDWFCAAVRLFKYGNEIDCEYLGCCCYKTEQEFYTRYKGDYFADMVHTLAENSKDAVLLDDVKAWRESLCETVTAQ